MKNNLEKEILALLHQNTTLSITELAGKLFVSQSTIRRNLNALQNKGLVKRTHGGAKLTEENTFYPSFTFRVHENSLEKKKIALSAIKLIKDGDLIFLDGSTSSFFITQYLSEFENIRVITNGIDTLSMLSKNNVKAYSTGGLIEEVNPSVLVGHYAEEMVKNFHADIVFFSARSVDANGEVYDVFEEENVIRKAMIRNATVKVLLIDNTKFNKTSMFHLCSLNDIDYIISNQPLPPFNNVEKMPKTITE